MANRRNLLFALAASAASAAAEQAAPAAPEEGTLYIPDRHTEKDRPFLLDFMDEYSFAMLVTGQPSVRITNVPTVLARAENGWGSIWWHLAKSNRQNAAMGGPVTAVFHGPHGYISPNWFVGGNAVPTWNFAVVHVTGTPRRVESDTELAAGLKSLVQQNEGRYGGGDKWSFDKLSESYLKGMRMGVIAYEMKIEKVEAKFKLGQERSEADRTGVLVGLEKSRKERDLRAFTKAYYGRIK